MQLQCEELHYFILIVISVKQTRSCRSTSKCFASDDIRCYTDSVGCQLIHVFSSNRGHNAVIMEADTDWILCAACYKERESRGPL